MSDWMKKLREVEALRNDGLIADEEFEVKRQEIVVPSSNDSFPSEKPPAPPEQVKIQTSNQSITKRISNPVLLVVGGAFLALATVGGNEFY